MTLASGQRVMVTFAGDPGWAHERAIVLGLFALERTGRLRVPRWKTRRSRS